LDYGQGEVTGRGSEYVAEVDEELLELLFTSRAYCARRQYRDRLAGPRGVHAVSGSASSAGRPRYILRHVVLQVADEPEH
jgi:hypothetical protein